jgi:GPI ethanolamine phosphate transferase 3 subunit O
MNRDGRPVQPPNEADIFKARAEAQKAASKPKPAKGDNEVKQKAITFKVQHALVTVFFIWLLVIHLLGILFFAKGFLLTRLILEEKSQCDVLPDGTPSQVQDGCWHPRTFDRAVVIIIDALRYDFTVPSGSNSPRPYQDAFPLLYETATSQPEHAVLLPFIADPPTTTLQRLKGLTTGSLPTFIEAGSNFAGTAIEEDNLVAQLKSAGKTLVHLGDDTWQALFPDHFDANLTHPYDSLIVWDLHTVDNGVIEHIMPLLQPTNNDNWDIIFAHMLGVDHAGHRYGPDHPAITGKLQQMDRQMRDIMNLIDDKTLLVIMGDHGMDTRGDHGGESDEEIEAALWMYSKLPKFGRTDVAYSTPPQTAKERPVRQIDLVPTLSLLLGMPIPFNNLGSPIEEAFIRPGTSDWKNLAAVNLLTFEQIQRFQYEYAKIRDLEPNHKQDSIYQDIQKLRQFAGHDRSKEVYTATRAWETETLDMYRRLWATFDVPNILHGLEIMLGGLIVLFVLSRMSRGDTTELMPAMLKNIYLGSGALAGIGSLLTFVPALSKIFSALSGMLYGLGIGGIGGAAVSFYQSKRLTLWPFPRSVWSCLALAFTISQAAGFAANSYTIHEDTILAYFLTTAGIFFLCSSLRQADGPDRVLGVYHSLLFTLLTRVASFSRLCREEQMPGCHSSFYASATTAQYHLILPYVIALVLPELIKAFYKGTASYEGSAGFWIGFCFRMGLLVIAAYWTVDTMDNYNWLSSNISEAALKTVGLSLARCTLAIALPVGIATFVWAKPCINIFFSPSDPDNTSPAAPTTKPRLTILGYANVHGTRYALLLPILHLTTAILLPPMGQFSLAILLWQIFSLLEILDANHLTSAASTIGPTVLAILGTFHFFKTGHQAVLSSIQWNAAYIPLRTLVYPLSPLIMVMNTFGAQIICAAAVPLTVLWKRSVRDTKSLWGDVARACVCHVLYYNVMAVATTMWAGHLRRHLMLYRVFMPRYLLAGVLLVVVDVVVIVISLTGVRVSGMSIGEVFGY